MPPKNAFYAQSGGVTAVINASACGVIETARLNRKRIGKVFAGRNGIIGALQEDLIDTSLESASAISALKQTPSGAFGSCRYKLKSLEQNRAEYLRLIDVFRAHDIGYFFYNGGGDSADTCLKVSQLSESLGYPLTAIHIPKTVDNDLPLTDNCPGCGFDAKDKKLLAFTISRKEIAQVADTTYESVIRSLAELQALELIELNGPASASAGGRWL